MSAAIPVYNKKGLTDGLLVADSYFDSCDAYYVIKFPKNGRNVWVLGNEFEVTDRRPACGRSWFTTVAAWNPDPASGYRWEGNVTSDGVPVTTFKNGDPIMQPA